MGEGEGSELNLDKGLCLGHFDFPSPIGGRRPRRGTWTRRLGRIERRVLSKTTLPESWPEPGCPSQIGFEAESHVSALNMNAYIGLEGAPLGSASRLWGVEKQSGPIIQVKFQKSLKRAQHDTLPMQNHRRGFHMSPRSNGSLSRHS